MASVSDSLDFALLNDYQRDFPLAPQPFLKIAQEQGTSHAAVLEHFARLRASGAISRIGAVFRPKALGASSLAAMAVPEADLQQVAERISAFPEVNHNYEREHRYNLWFVAAARSQQQLADALARIEAATGHAVLNLPLVEDYHIDLGFDLSEGAAKPAAAPGAAQAADFTLVPADVPLVEAIETGLDIVPYPYQAVGERAGTGETQVMAGLARLLAAGAIKRFGVVVRHHELGYTANAMAVWNVPDERVTAAGRRLAALDGVTLCYRRKRGLPHWPYNLFCMVHGRDRGVVEARLASLTAAAGLGGLPHAVLFSRRRFKQRGAHYFARELAHG